MPERAMPERATPERDASRNALVALLVIYAGGRVLQVFPTQVPTLLIVLLHVLPPAVFAFIHGRRVFGTRGIVVFMVLSLAVGGFFESLSLRSGFPFGHYYFTGVMGPRVFQLPILLAFAWVGVGLFGLGGGVADHWGGGKVVQGADRFAVDRGGGDVGVGSGDGSGVGQH
jgi:putative membrane protein